MMINDRQQTSQVYFKTLRPDEWPRMSKWARKEHERTRNRGFTPEEIRWFKNHDRWMKGEYVEKPTGMMAA